MTQSKIRLTEIANGQPVPCCPEMFGTHLCKQLFPHDGTHQCACGRSWRTGAKAAITDYNPKYMTNEMILQLAQEHGLR